MVTVRHYPPEQWLVFTPKQNPHDMPGNDVRIPWLPNPFYLSDGALPASRDRCFAAVLQANHVGGADEFNGPPVPYRDRLMNTTCPGCDEPLFATAEAALAHLTTDPTGTGIGTFCPRCNDVTTHPTLTRALRLECGQCGGRVFGTADEANAHLRDDPGPARLPAVCHRCSIRLDILGPDLDPLAPRD